MRVHRLAHHGAETLCGREVIIIRDEIGVLTTVLSKQTKQRMKIAWTAHTSEQDCVNCACVYRRISFVAGGTRHG